MPLRPHVVVLAGPNGAGKSTAAPRLLRGRLGVSEFVNADTVARGLSAFAPEEVAVTAGRHVLRRLEELAALRRDFAFETTLATRTLAPRLERWRRAGYAVHVVFLWLPTADLAVARVQARVRAGGHDVPEETVRRRYRRGIENLFGQHQGIATSWRLYDNAGPRPRLIAHGTADGAATVRDRVAWERVRETACGG